MDGHFLANSLAGLGVLHPAHGPSNVGLAVEHSLRRFHLQVEGLKHFAPQLRFGRGEHGYLGFVGQGPEATQSCNSRDGKIIPSVDIRDVLGGRAGENTSNVP